MTDRQPIACSLSPSNLESRLAEIAAVGTESLTSRTSADGRNVLRFRADEATRARLNAIVEAEAECCSFLDLALTEDGDELVLTITAPDEARPIADDLASAFANGAHHAGPAAPAASS